MHRIYIAGPMTPKGTGNHAIEYLENVRNGVHAATTLIRAGFAVYCPMIDFQLFLGLKDGQQISEGMIRSLGLTFIEHWAEAIYLLPGWETSTGVVRDELPAANENFIPQFEDIGAMFAYFESGQYLIDRRNCAWDQKNLVM